jgi:hypothetical protein
MKQHPTKIQARVSGKAALFTAATLLLTSVAQYTFDKDFSAEHSYSRQASANPAQAAAADSRERVTAEAPENPVRGGKVSLMIFRIN